LAEFTISLVHKLKLHITHYLFLSLSLSLAVFFSLSPGVDWVLLSGCYVETDGDVEGWRDLFIRLGVRERLILRKERRTLTSKELVRREDGNRHMYV
jgi:hypothetical protein